MKPAIACIAVGVLVAGCSGQVTRPETTEVTRIPEYGDWFCQLADSGDGWDCVQDETLAENPQPERLPEPRQAQEPELDPLPLPQTGPSLTEPSAQGGAPADGPAPGAEADPAEAAPPPRAVSEPEQLRTGQTPEGASPGAAAGPATSAPTYARLAYQPPEPVALTELPSEFYAVQVLAMSTPQQIEAFVRRHGIEGVSAARVEREGEIYYVLLLGIYETLDIAREAVADLPAPFTDTSVWIRPLGSLQSAMLRAERLAAAGG